MKVIIIIVAFVLLTGTHAVAAPAPVAVKRTGHIVQSESATEAAELVRSGQAGTVVALLVKPGDLVLRGQLLAHLDLATARLNLDTARANLEAKGTLNQMEAQHQAAIVARMEVAEAVRKRHVPKSRLEHAIAMERFANGQREAQLDLKKVQQIHFDHYLAEYERCLFRAPLDGTVTQVLVGIGHPVGLAVHAFTVSNEEQLSIPVVLSTTTAQAALRAGKVPIRAKTPKPVTAWATVAGATDPPAGGSGKILRLLANKSDLPASAVAGTLFEVLLPESQPQAG